MNEGRIAAASELQPGDHYRLVGNPNSWLDVVKKGYDMMLGLIAGLVGSAVVVLIEIAKS